MMRPHPHRFGPWLFGALILGAWLGTAHAHSFAPALLDLRERDAGVFDVAWKIRLAEAESVAGPAFDFAPQFPPQCRRLDNEPGLGSSEEEPAFWRIDCGSAGLGGASISVRGIDGSRLDVILRIQWLDGTTTTGVLRSGANVFTVADRAAGRPAQGTPAGRVLVSYMQLGIEHILLGFDHLLFVFALLLLVPNWSLLFKTISAFTLAHSLTLSLAVLGIVHIPGPPVEAMIALSIVLLAVELAQPAGAPRTLAQQRPWAVAFVFGLLHGLGFAGALSQIGLPADQIPLALLGFNLGVETGQIVFVAAAMGPLTVLKRHAYWPRLRLVPTYAIGVVAVALALERLTRLGGGR